MSAYQLTAATSSNNPGLRLLPSPADAHGLSSTNSGDQGAAPSDAARNKVGRRLSRAGAFDQMSGSRGWRRG